MTLEDGRMALVFDRVGCFALCDYCPANEQQEEKEDEDLAVSTSLSSPPPPNIAMDNVASAVFNDMQVAKWLIDVQQQLVELHQAGFGHCDVKPSNIVCYTFSGASRHFATLIDFEHVMSLRTCGNTSFSASVRYASRRIFHICKSQGRAALPYDFDYLPEDDFESLFYTAFEVLTEHKRLPWADHRNQKSPLELRNQLLTDDHEWENYRTMFSASAWSFLCAARLSINNHPTYPPFRPSL